jgi:hypothetical protein
LSLPTVTWKEVVERHVELNIIKPDEEVPDSYLTFLRRRISDFQSSAWIVFTDKHVLKWSVCYALFLCGYLQIGNYIQTLWSTAHGGKNQTYNAIVEGVIPLISIFAIMPIQTEWIDFKKHGEMCIILSALLQALTLFVIQLMRGIWFMYLLYGLYRITYQIIGTIAQ